MLNIDVINMIQHLLFKLRCLALPPRLKCTRVVARAMHVIYDSKISHQIGTEVKNGDEYFTRNYTS